ncbi:MAG: DeoR/GlpR transcriptional regulator [Desulfobulbaceae bacterium]|nr:MAG: DeoR/GlpR transcriptional regulator [Desulfobulbaceae bacterium]
MTDVVYEDNFSERQEAILSQVVKNGFVTIEALAAQFNVSAQTIRREIIELSSRGRLQRFHGGAGPLDTTESARLDYQTKRSLNQREKAIVGRKAASMIPDGATIYLDVGTTVEACAHDLTKRPGFTVFTNSMRSAMAFDPTEHNVFLLGGRMAGRDGSLIGDEIVQKLADVHLDFSVIACSGIDKDSRVMDFDMAKISIKRAAISVANKCFLVATHTKFNRTALVSIAHLDQFDEVITDTP